MDISHQLVLPARINYLILNLGGSAENLAMTGLSREIVVAGDFSLRVNPQRAAVADCGLLICRKLQQIQWWPSALELLIAKGIFPLSSTTVVFADRLGGYDIAARVIAGLCRFVPIINGINPPSLIVVCTANDCTRQSLERTVTLELLEMLRAEHPEQSYSTTQARDMWMSKLSNLRVLNRPPSQSLAEVMEDAKSRTEVRKNGGYGLSERHFSRLIRYTVQVFDQKNDLRFNALQAFGIDDTITNAAKSNFQAIFKNESLCVKTKVVLAASCLAINVYRGGASGKLLVTKSR